MRWPRRATQRALQDFAWAAVRPEDWRVRGTAWWGSMGSGKSSAFAHYAAETLHERWDVTKWLITAPKFVAEVTWPAEFAKWDGLKHLKVDFIGAKDFTLVPSLVVWRAGDECEILEGDLRPGEIVLRKGALALPDKRGSKRGLRQRLQDAEIAVVAVEFLPWLVKTQGANWMFDGVCLDESRMFAAHDSLRTRAVTSACKKGRVNEMVQLSGKPMPNGYTDLWSQMRLLDGGKRMGRTLTEFHDDWCKPVSSNGRGQVYKWDVLSGRKAELAKSLSEIAINVHHDIGVPLQEVDHYVALPERARRVYDEMLATLVAQLSPTQTILSANQAVLAGKLHQIAQGAIYDADKLVHELHEEKLDRLAELLEGLDGPVLLAYPFKHDLLRLKKRFPRKLRHLGSSKDVADMIAGKVQLGCVHPASLSHGVDGIQQLCNQVVWFGVTSNAEHYEQLNARVHRPGQKKGTVFVHRLLAQATVDERIAFEVLPNKIGEQDAMLMAVRPREWRNA